MALAGLSLAGFVFRWVLMVRGSAWVHHAPNRVLPHVVDTLFLLTGIGLAVMLRINPVQQPWLAAKLIGLVVYIALAWCAYRRFRGTAAGVALFLLALAVFAWIASVARLKHPLGFLTLFGA